MDDDIVIRQSNNFFFSDCIDDISVEQENQRPAPKITIESCNEQENKDEFMNKWRSKMAKHQQKKKVNIKVYTP